MTNEKETFAVFDFDGTISTRDVFLPFVFFTWGYVASFLKLLSLSPQLLAYVLGLISRQSIKEKILSRFFKGKALKDLEILGARFCEENLGSYLKPHMLKRIEWHKAQGHRIIIVSANVGFYIVPWAKNLGFEAVIHSQLETSNGIVTGKLIGLNCWGDEKLRRLQKAYPEISKKTFYTYGDSKGDAALLNAASHKHYRY